MKSGKVLLGILAGAAAGAMAGILFAPEKGSKTRKKIMRKGEGYVDDLKEKFDGLLDAITDKYESIQKQAENLLSNGHEKLDEVKKDIKIATN